MSLVQEKETVYNSGRLTHIKQLEDEKDIPRFSLPLKRVPLHKGTHLKLIQGNSQQLGKTQTFFNCEDSRLSIQILELQLKKSFKFSQVLIISVLKYN